MDRDRLIKVLEEQGADYGGYLADVADIEKIAHAILEEFREHTAPTDEREALSEFLFTVYEHGSQPNALREADAILSFLRSRHGAPAEPAVTFPGETEPRHSSLGYLAPADYTRTCTHQLETDDSHTVRT